MFHRANNFLPICFALPVISKDLLFVFAVAGVFRCAFEFALRFVAWLFVVLRFFVFSLFLHCSRLLVASPLSRSRVAAAGRCPSARCEMSSESGAALMDS